MQVSVRTNWCFCPSSTSGFTYFDISPPPPSQHTCVSQIFYSQQSRKLSFSNFIEQTVSRTEFFSFSEGLSASCCCDLHRLFPFYAKFTSFTNVPSKHFAHFYFRWQVRVHPISWDQPGPLSDCSRRRLLILGALSFSLASQTSSHLVGPAQTPLSLHQGQIPVLVVSFF